CGRWRTLRSVGLPHSEILGSQLVCSSPRLIAAYHVLRRLPVPRHPPCALTRLISLLSVSRCDSSTPHTPLVSCQRTKTARSEERGKCGRQIPGPFDPAPYGTGILGAPERR